MLERLLIAAALVALGTGGFALFRYSHLRRASRASVGAGKPRLLYFRSDFCGPCAAQERYVRLVEAEFGDRILVEKVDADRDQATAERYGVFTLPTTLIVDAAGKVTHANYGLADTRRLASQLSALQTQWLTPTST